MYLPFTQTRSGSRHFLSKSVSFSMVLILDGNSEIGAYVRVNICYLICLLQLLRASTVTNRIFSPKRPIILYACATCYELPSDISIIGVHILALKTMKMNLNLIKIDLLPYFLTKYIEGKKYMER